MMKILPRGLQLEPGDIDHLKISWEKRLQRYNVELGRRLELFSTDHNEEISKLAQEILKYLFDYDKPALGVVTGELGPEYSWVPLRYLNRDLVRFCGAPHKDEEEKSRNTAVKERQNRYTALLRTLGYLEECRLIERKKDVDLYSPRSKTDKKKTNTFYRISPDVFSGIHNIEDERDYWEGQARELGKQARDYLQRYRRACRISEEKGIKNVMEEVEKEMSEREPGGPQLGDGPVTPHYGSRPHP
jgi:hypothetical protein